MRIVQRLLPALGATALLALAAQAHAVPFQSSEEPAASDLLNSPKLWSTPDAASVFQPVVEALRRGDLEAAGEALQPLLSSHSKHPGTWELEGTYRLMLGAPAQAAESLRRALTLAPGNSSATAKLGVIQLQLGHAPEAKRLLTAAVEQDPDNGLAHYYLARMARARGNVASATQHYKAAVAAVDTADAPPVLELAALYHRSSQYEAVIRLLASRLSDRTAVATDARLMLANAYLEQGELDASANELDVARRLDPENPNIEVMRARLDWKQGKLDAAERKLRGVLDRRPGHGLAYYQLGITLLSMGDSSGAIAALEKAQETITLPLETRLELAAARVRAGQVRTAVSELQRLAEESADPRPLRFLARALQQQGRLEEALAVAAELVRRHPRRLSGYLLKADLLQVNGDHEKAVAMGRSAVKRFAGAREAWVAYANLHTAGGDYKNAIRASRRGLELHPDSAVLRFTLASAYQRSGRAAEAEREYRRILRSDPTNVVTLNNLALLLVETPSTHQQALKLANRAHQQAPDIPAVEDTLGWVLYRNGNHAAAITHLESAYERLPNDAELGCRLGLAYASADSREQATRLLEQCVQKTSQPDLRKQAHAALSRL